MRLFRPAPCTRSMASTEPPSKVCAAAAAAATPGSAAPIEQHLGDSLPSWTYRPDAKSARCGEQDRKGLSGKIRIGEHLLQIVDEMRATDRAYPRDRASPCAPQDHPPPRNP